MRISNLVNATQGIQNTFTELIPSGKDGRKIFFAHTRVDSLLSQMQNLIMQTDQLCSQAGGSPADLPTRSLRAYQWIKFLCQRKWLWLHLYALVDFYDLSVKEFPSFSRENLQTSLQINCYHSSYLYHCQKKSKKIILEINEGFISSPPDLKRSILKAALQRRSAECLKTIRQYTATSEYKTIHANMQDNQIGSRLRSKGEYIDLADVFTEVNQTYFKGQIEPTRLVWSSKRSIRRLGYYHPESNTIAISRILDGDAIPHYVLSFVMYHEMLHKKIGLKAVNGRRYAHTKAFKEAERKFKSFTQAEQFIKQLQKNIY